MRLPMRRRAAVAELPALEDVVGIAASSPNSLSGLAAILGNQIANHGSQPIPKTPPGRIIGERIPLSENFHHDILHDLLGGVVRAAALLRKSKDQPPVAVGELLPGERVCPVAEPFEQGYLVLLSMTGCPRKQWTAITHYVSKQLGRYILNYRELGTDRASLAQNTW